MRYNAGCMVMIRLVGTRAMKIENIGNELEESVRETPLMMVVPSKRRGDNTQSKN